MTANTSNLPTEPMTKLSRTQRYALRSYKNATDGRCTFVALAASRRFIRMWREGAMIFNRYTLRTR